ncbi:MAG: UDP-glucose/GDP-mannose dehydrogenase family protein [DPANN group archaeon]|nr:UDP-glucose/GDP-mannose dehydrogenase family protein [DPANN group archaeon]
MKIAVVGWGYVGASTGLGFKDHHEIIAYDPYKLTALYSINVLRELPAMSELVKIQQVYDVADLREAEIIFVCLPTPTTENGVDVSYIDKLLDDLNKSLDKGVVIIRSTTPPGTVKKYQEKYPKFQFLHNPEFLRERTPVSDFLNPDRIIIGGAHEDAIKKAMDVYKTFDCPKIVTDSTTSEMIKYASNIFLANKISYFNEMHKIAQIVGADSKKMSEAVALDRRIGHYGVYGSRPYGGSCLPKDTDGFIYFVENNLKHTPHLLKAVKHINDIFKQEAEEEKKK